jgi:hypothetical protein
MQHLLCWLALKQQQQLVPTLLQGTGRPPPHTHAHARCNTTLMRNSAHRCGKPDPVLHEARDPGVHASSVSKPASRQKGGAQPDHHRRIRHLRCAVVAMCSKKLTRCSRTYVLPSPSRARSRRHSSRTSSLKDSSSSCATRSKDRRPPPNDKGQGLGAGGLRDRLRSMGLDRLNAAGAFRPQRFGSRVHLDRLDHLSPLDLHWLWLDAQWDALPRSRW